MAKEAAPCRVCRRYFETLKSLVKSIILLSKQYANGRPRNFVARKADLLARLRKHLNLRLGHPRADKFIRKLSANRSQLVACLDFPEVCAHNNIAERCLRDNVIMRKITFGNRSFKHSGQRNHEVIMSLIQTARMQNLNPLTFLRNSPHPSCHRVRRASPCSLFRALNYYEESVIRNGCFREWPAALPCQYP